MKPEIVQRWNDDSQAATSDSRGSQDPSPMTSAIVNERRRPRDDDDYDNDSRALHAHR